jgi:hypothetical protein
MSRDAELREFQVRLRRICPDARGRYSPSHEPSRRWQVWEEHELALSTGDTEDEILKGVRRKVEGCVCWAATELEARHLYSRIKQEQKQQDTDIAAGRTPKGKPWTILLKEQAEQQRAIPPPEPPEWEQDRERIAWAARQSKERTTEQIRATVRNFMALQNVIPDARAKRLLGIGRAETWHKGK